MIPLGYYPDSIAHSALLIVDIQETFKDLVPGYEDIVKRSCLAIECASLLNIPILYTEQNPRKLGKTDPRILELLTTEDTYSAKMSFSACGSSEIKDWLKRHNISRLYIGGLEASVCIFQTAIEAIDSFHEVVLLRDCIGGRREQDTAAVVNYFSHRSIPLLPVETIFYSLISSAEHPSFKQFVNIVKKYS